MASYSQRPIEPNTRLHHREAASLVPSSGLGTAYGSNPALHVDGWHHQQPQNPHNNAFMAVALGTAPEPSSSSSSSSGTKRTRESVDHHPRSNKRSFDQVAATTQHGGGGVRITDLLNPAVVPAIAAAHRMTLPSALSRTQSDDAKYAHQQVAAVIQRAKQPAEPVRGFVRTATAPSIMAAADPSCAQGLVREALELDKLYDIACVIIESIWPNHSTSQRTQLCSLRCFVAETHRQSRLGIDVLELCMFYLLRAKSIIQAKQRAAAQHKEDQKEGQLKEKHQQMMVMTQQQQQQQQQAQLEHSATPPLSPDNQYIANNSSGAAATIASVARAKIHSDMGRGSPITPASAGSVGQQILYVEGDRHQMLRSGLITSFVPADTTTGNKHQDAAVQHRPLAGMSSTLPNSFRSFVCKTNNANVQLPSPHQQEEQTQDQQQNPQETPKAPAKPDVTKCGRRMFVAAIISASKFIYDQTYSNRAWHKITKLPLTQISDMERAFLDMIDYRLYVDRTTYDKFHRLLARSGMRNGRLMVCDPAYPMPTSPTSSASVPAAGESASPWMMPTAQQSADNTEFAQQQHYQQQQQQQHHQQKHNVMAANNAPSAQVPFTPTSAMDLRTAMSVPLSITSTPVIQRAPPNKLVPLGMAEAAVQMQEQVIGMLRTQQQRQQHHNYHHQTNNYQQQQVNYHQQQQQL